MLLSEPARAARLEMLGDALTPADPAAAGPGISSSNDGDGDELLETTPLRLLQQVELALKRMVGGEGEASVAGRFAALLPGAAPAFLGIPGSIREVLEELRSVLLARVEQDD